MRASLVEIALGGGIGAIARFGMLQWLGGVNDGGLLWGTFTANALGSLFLGFVVGLSERGAFGEKVRLFITVGLLGGFTTFSFLSYENLELLRDERYLALVFNSAGQLLVGLLAAVAGYAASRQLPHKGP